MTMRVRDIMNHDPITVDHATSVADAHLLLKKRGIRHLPVTGDGRLVGIITDRDIRLCLPSPATSLSVWEINYLLARLSVGQVMSKTLIVVEPERDAGEAARIMMEHTIGALPVVDGGRLVGIVTETDFLRAFATLAAPAREPAA